jgi:hypothetical protein
MKTIAISNMRAVSLGTLERLAEPMAVTWHGHEPIAVIVPYAQYQAMRAAAEALVGPVGAQARGVRILEA